MNAIEITHLSKGYGKIKAVEDLNLTVKEGELFALLGVNGAGKTTAVKLLSCLTKPDSGDAYILGNSISREPAAVKKIIAVSPQETAVAPNLTVAENLRLICGVHGFSKEKTEKKVKDTVEKFSLESVAGRRAGKLSGGFQRRLSIAMALISEPKVLFLDEPTLGLDVIARSELWDMIRELKGRITVVLTTHYMEEAEALSDRLAIMKDGTLLACDTAEVLKKKTGKAAFGDAFLAIVKEGRK